MLAFKLVFRYKSLVLSMVALVALLSTLGVWSLLTCVCIIFSRVPSGNALTALVALCCGCGVLGRGAERPEGSQGGQRALNKRVAA